MRGSSLLPPVYLLPAWSSAQLNVLRSQALATRRSNRYSTLTELRQASPANTTTESYTGATHATNGSQLQRIRMVRSYADRNKSRYERGNEEIRKRLNGERNGLIRKHSGPRRFEEDGEAKMIADYIARKKVESLNTQKISSSSRILPVKSSTLRPYADFTKSEDSEIKHSPQDIDPAALGSNSFESLEPALFPSYKAAQVSPQGSELDTSLDIQTESNNLTGNDSVQRQSSTSSSNTNGKAQVPSQRSLLEELFPEEAAKLSGIAESQATTKLRHAEPEELALPAADGLESNDASNRPRVVLPKKVVTRASNIEKLVPVLLVLENALPNLILADFKRTSPKGQHIEEWKSKLDPLVIIPARVHRTGECTGKYYLVFKKLSHAKEWKARVDLLHRIARKHAATSIVAPIVPQKGFTAGGEDIGETLREYSVFSTGVEPVMRLYSDPRADPTIRDELKMIESMLPTSEKPLRAGRSVLMWIDGWSLGTDEIIRKLLQIDGKTRNMPWGGWMSPNILEEYRDQIPSLRNRDKDSTSSSMKVPRKWLITLRDEAEARRFVRSWHLRPFPAWQSFKRDSHDEPWPLIRTEFVW